jgi:hypothetical protein
MTILAEAPSEEQRLGRPISITNRLKRNAGVGVATSYRHALTALFSSGRGGVVRRLSLIKDLRVQSRIEDLADVSKSFVLYSSKRGATK